MTQTSRIRDDWIDAIFRPVIGFFAGLALGYVVQLAQVSSGVFASSVLVLVAGLVAAILLLDTVLSRLIDKAFDWIGWGNGIKPSKTKHKPHWFVRIGWVFALGLGMIAVFILPEGALAWLL